MKLRALAFFNLLVGLLAVALSALPAQAQNNAPLQLGTWSSPPVQTQNCKGLQSPCYSVNITCPNAEPLVATYAVELPSGTSNGTIVLFSGAGGTSPFTDAGQEGAFASYYLRQHYTVVQFFWMTDWEDTNNGLTGHVPYAWNVQTAACRPATFLWYAFEILANGAPSSGFCAQGSSGGSGAIAYSMAWYGAGWGTNPTPRLDKVELAVGPPFSDIEQGCEEPETLAPPLQICPNNYPNCICPPDGSPNWCAGWVGESAQALWYDDFSGPLLGKWTGDNTCQNPTLPNDSTSASSNTNWYKQSIVEIASGNGNFQYPNTSMLAWLCASVQQGTGSVNQNTPQGWLLYQEIANSGTPLDYQMTAVQNCNGAEGFTDSKTKIMAGPYSGLDGMTAVKDDMAGPSLTRVCEKPTP